MSEGLITPDFSEVQDSVEPGIYKTRIKEYKLDKWQGKDGKPDTNFINWTLETFGEEESKNNGRKIFHRTPVHGKGAFRLRDFYKAVVGEALVAGQPFDPSMLVSREVEVTVVQQKDNPEYTDIKTVKKLQ